MFHRKTLGKNRRRLTNNVRPITMLFSLLNIALFYTIVVVSEGEKTMKNVLRVFAAILVAAAILSACSTKNLSNTENSEIQKREEQTKQIDPTEAKEFDQSSAEETLGAYMYALFDGNIETFNDCLLVKYDPAFGDLPISFHKKMLPYTMTRDMVTIQGFEFYPQDLLEAGKTYVQADEFEVWQAFKKFVCLNCDEESFDEVIEYYTSVNPDWKQAMLDEIDEMSDEDLRLYFSCSRDEVYQRLDWLEKYRDEINSLSNLSKLDVSKITAFCKVEFDSYGCYFILAQVGGKWYVTHSSLGYYFGN